MMLHVNDIRCGDCIRAITDAVLRVDLGARVNVSAAERQVRIEGRVSVEQARRVIEQRGFAVSRVIYARATDTAVRRRDDRSFVY